MSFDTLCCLSRKPFWPISIGQLSQRIITQTEPFLDLYQLFEVPLITISRRILYFLLILYSLVASLPCIQDKNSGSHPFSMSIEVAILLYLKYELSDNFFGASEQTDFSKNYLELNIAWRLLLRFTWSSLFLLINFKIY